MSRPSSLARVLYIIQVDPDPSKQEKAGVIPLSSKPGEIPFVPNPGRKKANALRAAKSECAPAFCPIGGGAGHTVAPTDSHCVRVHNDGGKLRVTARLWCPIYRDVGHTELHVSIAHSPGSRPATGVESVSRCLWMRTAKWCSMRRDTRSE